MLNRLKLLSVIIWTFILFACMNTIELTISFESNGGSVVESITTDGQHTIQFPEDPTKEGYVFAGWYWDNNTFRDLFTLVSLTERGITSNFVVYAKWEDDENYVPIGSVKVTFDSGGGTSVLPVFITPGKTILIPEVSKLGYTLEGWYTSVNNGVTLDEKWSFTSSIVNNNITLYAKWNVNLYTVTFNSNGGTSLNSIVFEFNEAIDVSFTPTKIGHTFEGWFIDERLDIPFDLETMPAEDVTLYAKWQINQYTLTFDSNGGTNVSSILLEFNSLINAPEDPSKEGFSFAGWYIDSTLVNAYTFTTMPDENLTLFAKWEATYTGYYASINGKTGNELLLELRTIINNGIFRVSYGEARYILNITDRDPLNSNNVILVYRGTSVSGTWDGGTTWNREHVWPQSLLGVETNNTSRHVGADLHNLKPANPSENSSRGNKYFDNTTTTVSYSPRVEVRGDVARILFYMVVMYDYLELINSTPTMYKMAMLNTLLQWHIDDPVDDFERNRNDVIYFYQKNRNPFIDHPELVNQVFGFPRYNQSHESFLYDIYYQFNKDIYLEKQKTSF
jgi:uncharacterized repeat protein (TIGR02543 family)